MAEFAPSTIDESGTIADLQELTGTDIGSIINAALGELPEHRVRAAD